MKFRFLFCITLSLFFFKSLSAQNQLRSIEELSVDTSGWKTVKGWIDSAKNKVEILSVDNKRAKESLYQAQVTTHSIMGAIIYNSAGMFIDHGWLRILGSGNIKLDRSLMEWNKGKSFKDYGNRPTFLLVADDVIGGFFAINGGALGNDMGNIYYLAPDKLAWEDLKMSYSDFIFFCLNGDLSKFYSNQQWKGWEDETSKLSGIQSFFFYPYLWTVEGKDIDKDKRSIVPVNEVYIFETDALKKLTH